MLFIIRNLISFVPLILAIVLALLGNTLQTISAWVMWSAIKVRNFSALIAGDKEPPMPFPEQQRHQLRVVGRRRPMTPGKDSLPN